ncbi:MAG TPA: FecR domain-containing protein [Puia sp.]|jgi:ferric-dicitrate binding protein FerR (iron transport regulator)
MSRRPIQIEELIIKYARGQHLSKQELAQFREWRSRSENHQVLPEKFRDPDWLRENLRRLENVPSDRMWDFIQDRIALDLRSEPQRTPGHLPRIRQWTPYAAAVLLITIGWLVFKHPVALKRGEDIPVPVIARAGAMSSGSNQVLLTLGDGTVLPLDHIPNGKVAEQGDLILTKTDSNRLEYTLKAGGIETAINSRITTGQTTPFHLVFPDGSTVKLSYASSLSTAYRAGKRELGLSGEALFETARNSHEPFIVVTKKVRVEVLGTLFDVSNYEDESTATISLLSGAVKVIHGGGSKLLKPLQVATVRDKTLDVHRLLDSADVLSWTSNDPVLHFDNTDLNTVIRSIARWHQVKVYNPDHVTGTPITGVFRQKESLEVTLGSLDRAERGYAFIKRKGDTIEVSTVASR